ADVSRALAEQAREAPVVAKEVDPKSLGDTVIRSGGGKVIYLRDVAEVRGAPLRTSFARVNRRRQVCLPIYAKPGTRRKELNEAVGKALRRAKESLPQDVDLRWRPFVGADAGRLLTLYVRAPTGTRLEATEELVARVEQRLAEQI